MKIAGTLYHFGRRLDPDLNENNFSRLIELLHPDASLIDAEQVPNQFAEVHPAIGLEEEGKFVAIELIFGINDAHRKTALHDLVATNLDQLHLLLVLEGQKIDLLLGGAAGDPLEVGGARAPRSLPITVASAGGGEASRVGVEVLGRQQVHDLAQILATVGLDLDERTNLNVPWSPGSQDEVAMGPLELDVVDDLGAGAQGRRGRRAGHGGDAVLRQDDGLVVLLDGVIHRLLLMVVLVLLRLAVHGRRRGGAMGGESATPMDRLVLVVLVRGDRRRHNVSRCAVAPPHR